MCERCRNQIAIYRNTLMFLIQKLEALEIDKLETLERLQMGLYFYKKSCVCEAYKTRQT